ncbi:MAG: CDP-alcohol phosphatidyltransferase family protein, partial [Lentisphaeria bacterium]|nr:CDP-alcohol phosphatidyltransferase family protein [Lentisphaeria bacterium]
PDEWYANTLTLANFLCGIAAIGSVYAGHPLRAFVLVFLGQFFDLFDGRLARIFGSTRHGPMFDDVADGTSFGAATAYLVMTELSKHLPIAIAVSLAVFYVGCVIYRLHRFLHPKVALPDGVFDGMPSPAGALLAAASALLFGSTAPWLAALLVAAASLLMISHLRYRHFARSIWPALPRAIKPVICIVAIIFADAALAHKLPHVSFSLCCFLIGLAYTFYGIDFRFYRGTRKTPATRTQTAPAGEG